MRFIIGFLLYWFSTIGYMMLLVKKFKIRKEFSFTVFTSLLIIILFLASILNMLLIVSILIFLGGFLFYYYLYKNKILNKDFCKSFFDYKFFLFASFIIYFAIICSRLHLMHYDNFSHWALSIKQLFLHHTLGSFKYNVDTFTSYPPGSALFTYYFGLISSKNEMAMLIGHSYLNLAFMMPITILFSEKNKVKSSLLFVLLVLTLSCINIKLNELLVDTTLGLMGITTFIYTFINRDDYKKCFYGLTISSILFILVKNSGIVFVALNGILFYMILKHNNKVKEGIKYLFLMFLITGGIFFIWQQHLSMVYPSDDGYTSQHSVSINNVGRNILKKGPDKILEIVKLYFNKMLSIKNNIINQYLIGFNLIMLFMGYIYKNRRKIILKSLLFLNILAFLYYIALGAMYIVSMPYEEALYLACFERYMLTSIVVLMGILIINIYFNLTNKHKLNLGFYILILFSCIFIIFNNDYKVLIGIDDYDNSLIKDTKKIYEKINLDKYQEYNKIFYLENKNSCSFYTYGLRYYYFDPLIRVTCDDINFDSYQDNTLFILEEENDKFNNVDLLEKIDKNIYMKK